MLFLLSQDDHPLLLIDQPEDDLDSQTVYEEAGTRNKKGAAIHPRHPQRQFSCPWGLGDCRGVCIRRNYVGCCRQHRNKRIPREIVSIMEGGKEAFDRRKTIYEIWDAADG
jgi:chromosome segregation protein